MTKITIKEARKVWLSTVAFEVIIFIAVGFVWLFYISNIHVWWLAAIVLSIHFIMAKQRKKRCVCPHCGVSLIGFDGDSIFAKKCEHCDETF